MLWKGNALTGVCTAEVGSARAEIVISRSVERCGGGIRAQSRGGKTYWNVSIYDTNIMRFDQSSIVDFTVGQMNIGEAKETAATILEWANLAFEIMDAARGGE